MYLCVWYQTTHFLLTSFYFQIPFHFNIPVSRASRTFSVQCLRNKRLWTIYRLLGTSWVCWSCNQLTIAAATENRGVIQINLYSWKWQYLIRRVIALQYSNIGHIEFAMPWITVPPRPKRVFTLFSKRGWVEVSKNCCGVTPCLEIGIFSQFF